jgi:hypothetical protein
VLITGKLPKNPKIDKTFKNRSQNIQKRVQNIPKTGSKNIPKIGFKNIQKKVQKWIKIGV